MSERIADLVTELNRVTAERDELRERLDDPLGDVPPPELRRLLSLLDGTDAGRTAYAGYYASCGGRSLVSGQPIPDWDAQSGDIKRAWQSAAEFVIGLIADSLVIAAREQPGIIGAGTEHLAAELTEEGR